MQPPALSNFRIFFYLQRNPSPLAPHFLPHWSLWEPPIYFLSLWISLLWTLHVNGIIQCMTLCVLLLSPNICVHPIHPGCGLCQYFIPLIAEYYLFRCVNRPYSVYSFTRWWHLVVSTFLLFWIMPLCVFLHTFLLGCVFSVFEGIYLGVELLSQRVLSFNFGGNCQIFP